MSRPIGDPVPRLWARVEKSPDPDGCWIWTGAKTHAGYGLMGVGRTLVYTHRLSWELANGPSPKGLEVCHNCPGGDTPACCNPAHLFIGTHTQNMADAAAKQRMARGTRLPQTKFTDAQVREMHALSAGGIRPKEIARRYGARAQYISRILSGARRSHLKESAA